MKLASRVRHLEAGKPSPYREAYQREIARFERLMAGLSREELDVLREEIDALRLWETSDASAPRPPVPRYDDIMSRWQALGGGQRR